MSVAAALAARDAWLDAGRSPVVCEHLAAVARGEPTDATFADRVIVRCGVHPGMLRCGRCSIDHLRAHEARRCDGCGVALDPGVLPTVERSTSGVWEARAVAWPPEPLHLLGEVLTTWRLCPSCATELRACAGVRTVLR